MGKKADTGDIRAAVHEYLTELISERAGRGVGGTGAGGMALTANDLMVAAKSAGHKPSRSDASRLLDELLAGAASRPTPPAGPAQPAYLNCTKASRSRSRAPPATQIVTIPAAGVAVPPTPPPPPQLTKGGKTRPREDIYKYHWMMWKTGWTPTPAPTTPAWRDSPSARPATGSRTPATMIIRARTATPKPLTPAPPTRPATPEQDEGELEVLDDAEDPMAYARVATPAEFKNGVPPMSNDDTNAVQQADGGPQYMPALKAWVSGANDYERDVAFNLLQAMNGGRINTAAKMVKPSKPLKFLYRPKSAAPPKARPLGAADKRPKTAGIRTCRPAWRSCEGWADHSKITIDNAPPSQKLQYHIPKGFTHEGSTFMTANRPYHPDFIINPEFVSEEKSRRMLLAAAQANRRSAAQRQKQQKEQMFQVQQSYQY